MTENNIYTLKFKIINLKDYNIDIEKSNQKVGSDEFPLLNSKNFLNIKNLSNIKELLNSGSKVDINPNVDIKINYNEYPYMILIN